MAERKSNVAGADPTDIALESLFTMEVTTASKFPEKLSQAPGVISVVTQDELRRFGAMTLREALERVPGLVATTGYFSDRSMVAVRGDQSKDHGGHILILINGRPTRETVEGGVISDLLQSFPVNVIERIEVIRGPGSVLYGSNAFSGVINLITRKPSGSSATFRSYVAGPGAGGASGELLYQRGDLNLVAAGQLRYDPSWRPRYGFENLDIGDFASPLTYRPVTIRDRGPGAYLGLNYRGFRWLAAYTEWESAYFVAAFVGENRWRRGFTNVGYSFSPSSKWDMSLDLTHTSTRLRSSSFPYAKRASADTVFEWTNVVRPSQRDQITFGALYNNIAGSELYSLSSPATVVSKGSRSAGAFYAQLDHRFTEQLKVIGGVQSNKIGHLELDTVPRAGVIWSPAPLLHFKALYGRAYRAPSINETSINHPSLLGNPALQPEKVGTLDLGVSVQTNRFLASLNFFDSRQSGIINPDYTLQPVQYRNALQLNIRGIELEGKRYIGERLLLYGTLLYSHSRNAVIPTPRWIVSGGASYRSPNAFTFTLSDVYRSSIPTTPRAINPAASAYHQINAHARFELARVFGERANNLALFAHAVNLANREIWMPSWGGPDLSLPFARRRTLYYGIEVALFRE